MPDGDAMPAHPARRVAATALLALALTCAHAAAARALNAPDRVAGRLVVRFDPGVGAAERLAILGRGGADAVGTLPLPNAREARTEPGESVDAVVARLRADPRVRWAEPVFRVRAAVIPDDPLIPSQWGLINAGTAVQGNPATPDADIDADEAWDRTMGDPRVTVAVVDTGVAFDHPDVAPNLPPNPGESGAGREANGADDDGDGLVDDVRGWDFVDGDADPSEDPAGEAHGSHVAGTVAAASGNGRGGAGVAPRTSLLAVRALDADGEATTATIAAAFAYAGARGARVVNASLGGPARSQAIADAIAEAPQTLFVVAAGNDGADLDGPPDFDRDGVRLDQGFPCELPAPNLVCVAATTPSDALASFSDTGATSVDLAAPGTEILSTRGSSDYAYMSGTSMATPHVSGAAALILAEDRLRSTSQVRGALLAGIDPLPALAGRVATGGRLNARRGLDAVPAQGAAPAVAIDDIARTGDAVTVTGSVDPRGGLTTWWVEYGSTTDYGAQGTVRRAGAGDGPVAVRATLPAPPQGATLHARIVAARITGLAASADRELAPAPAAEPAPGPGAPAAAPAVAALGRPARGADGVWRVTLDLPAAERVRPRLALRRGGTFRGLRAPAARDLPAGRSTLVLGRRGPGVHRLRVAGAEAIFTVRLLRPRVAVRRSGRAAALSVRAFDPTRVLSVRLARAGGTAIARRHPAALAVGARRIALGALAPGRYRATVRLRALGYVTTRSVGFVVRR
ncbi:MAG: S8 family serine peptidase [Thermoleophilia bacterium]